VSAAGPAGIVDIADAFIFREDGAPALRGARCTACDAVFYPARPMCGTCGVVIDGDDVPIGREGALELFSISHVAPAGVDAPYVQGLVRLPEGPLVFARIDAPEEHWPALAPGTRLELRIGEVGDPAAGTARTGWWYATVQGVLRD
jgi:uncharacterized OB-fold protein